MYHYLTDDVTGTNHRNLRVRPAAFRRQMNYLKRRGYQTIHLSEWVDHVVNDHPVPPRPIVVTFDDGCRDSLFLAAQILDELGFTATVFMVSDRIGQTNIWDAPKGEPQFPLLGLNELRQLTVAGWEIGSHTRTHADLPTLSDEELAEELTGSKTKLEELLGQSVDSVAYPYGNLDSRVPDAARRAGYRCALSTRHGKNTEADDLFAMKRIIIKRRNNLLDFYLKLKKGRCSL